jgi:hypothetical protein
MASNSTTVPDAHARSASVCLAPIPVPHPGGKIPCPHSGQTPYFRSIPTSFPPRVCSLRFFLPFPSSLAPQCGHDSPSGPSIHSALALRLAVSDSTFARYSSIRRSTSASISRNVARGCCSRHAAIPAFSSSLNPCHFSLIFFESIRPPPSYTPYLTPSPKF